MPYWQLTNNTARQASGATQQYGFANKEVRYEHGFVGARRAVPAPIVTNQMAKWFYLFSIF